MKAADPASKAAGKSSSRSHGNGRQVYGTKFVAYLITNQVNEKRYVGITSRSLELRWKEHLAYAEAGDGFYLHNAMRRYGVDVFSIKEISKANDWQSLCVQERDLIAHFDTFHRNGRGYNLTLGGNGAWGWEPSAETRQRLKQRALERWGDPTFADLNKAVSKKNMLLHWSRPEFALARAATLAALHTNPEFAAARDARLVKLNTDPKHIDHRMTRWREWYDQPENTAAVRARFNELRAKPEFIAVCEAGQAAWWADLENVACASERMRKQRADPSFKEAYLAAMDKLWSDPEVVAAASVRMRALHLRPEFSAAVSANMKALHSRPEFAAARDARINEWNADPEKVAYGIARLREYRADPDVAVGYSKRMSDMRSDPSFVVKLLEAKALRSAEIDRLDPAGAATRKAQRAWRAAVKAGDKEAASALRREYRRLDAERKKAGWRA